MPRFYFHLHNDVEARDEEGQELADVESARAEALRGARELLAEAVRSGRVDLSHWIEVEDEAGERILTLRFGDSVDFEGSSDS